MAHLLFKWVGGIHNTYRVILNGKDVDGVDNNAEGGYTQAHLAIARARMTFQGESLDIEFDDSKSTGSRYMLSELLEKEMNLPLSIVRPYKL